MRVLLAIETSKSSERAVNAIIQQMDPAHTEVSILHVLPRRASRQTQGDARAHAILVEDRLSRAGFQTQTAVAEGDPRSTVVDHAARWKADLIVVGAYEQTGLSRFLTKSLADSIARSSPCSVQVVRTPAAPSKILLAMDDSESSEAALQQLIVQKQSQGAEVRVLHMIEPMPLIPDGQVWHNDAELAVARQSQYRNAEGLARRTAEALRSAGFQVSTVIEKGNPKSTVMDLAKQWQAGLIMLGSQCRESLGGISMEKVSQDVAVQAPCSVQITRI